MKNLLDFDTAKKRAPAENRGGQIKTFHGRSWIPILAQDKAEGWDEIGVAIGQREIEIGLFEREPDGREKRARASR